MTEQEFDQLLSKYADVVVRIGLNLRKGQRLLLRGILDDTGRPMLYINWNTDMGDGWEWSNAEEYPGYLKWTAVAYQMMINEIVYTLTH